MIRDQRLVSLIRQVAFEEKKRKVKNKDKEKRLKDLCERYCDIIQNLYISSTSQTPSEEESHGMCENGTLS